jgi:serine protease Do
MLLGILHRARARRGAVALTVLIGAAVSFTALTATNGPVDAQQRALSENGVKPYARAPLTFADIVDRVKPAVVSIKVVSGGERTTPSDSRGGRRGPNGMPFPDLPPDHPLNEFFKNFPRNYRNMPGQGGRGFRRPMRQSQGSGFVISPDGYVVTNNHVVRGGNKITVSFDDKENIPAEVVGTDSRTDLALLKIKAKRTFPYVRFADKSSRVGDWVVAVGNPFGLGGTVTVGVLSALSRNIGTGPYAYLQIDAAVNRGNSGGPTFNLAGEVIGVNTAIYSPSGGNVGIAFAVPSETAKGVIEQLKNKGSVQRGWLGVKIQTITDDIAASLGLDDPHGALVSELTPGAPAEKAGLRAGDAILTVDGDKIEDSRDLALKIAGYTPGATVKVGISRAGSSRTIDVELGTFPNSDRQASAPPSAQPKPRVTALETLGLDLALDTFDGPDRTKDRVVIRDVDPNSDAARKGLREDDQIIAVNGEKVSTPEDVDRIVKSAEQKRRKAVLLTVKRGAAQSFVAVQLSSKRG